jgi:DNA gyrase subunit A
MNFLSLEQGEQVTSVLPQPKAVKKSEALALLMVTKEGTVKKVDAENFKDVRRSGLIAISLAAGDELICARCVRMGDDVILVTAKGQSIRFAEADVRAMGRGAAGVRGIKLGKGDKVISAGIISKGEEGNDLFVMSDTGYGKKTALDEYKQQGRGGSGIKTAAVTAKTGELITASVVGAEGEIVAISQKSQVIRTGIDEIPRLGRQTQGVRVMRLRENDHIAACISLEGGEEEISESS